MATSDQSNTEYYGDQPTAEDLLGFREHAERLADEISRFDPNLPMVVGIEGKWGEGKTSFLLMMEAHWRRQNKLAPEWPELCKGWWLPCHWKALVKSVFGFLFGSRLECEQARVSLIHWLNRSNQLNKMEPVRNSGLIFFKFKTLRNWIADLRGKLPREDRKIHLIKFDPWWFSGKEKLLERFLDEIKAKEPFYALLAKGVLSGLKGGFDKHNRYWLKIFSSAVVVAFASSRFADLALLISREVTVPTKDELQTSIEIVSILSAVFAILFFMLIGEVVEKLLNFIFPTDMEKKRARLERKLRRSPVQRIIIVDDIDRLPDDELQELFRVIKSVAAMPNIVYILLYDRTAVAGVLDKLHANRGEQFLEKIVQLPNRLPTPTKTASQEAAYRVLSALPEIKDFLLQKSYEKGLNLIVGTLIPNLRQAKRMANMVKIGLGKDIEINVLLFVFLESLRLHSSEMWRRLCFAMVNYGIGPSGATIMPGENSPKSRFSKLDEQKEWMTKHGLINKEHELLPPFAGVSEKLIECIVYFTGLTLSGDEEKYIRLPFYVPGDIYDDQHLYLSDVFGKYVHTKLDEERLSVEIIREKLLNLNDTAAMIEFCVSRKLKFGYLNNDMYDIRYYLRSLSSAELIKKLDVLYGVAKLAAASAESIYLLPAQTNIEYKPGLVKYCENIFFGFYQLSYTRESIDSAEVLNKLKKQEEQLFAYIAKETPIFVFELKSIYDKNGFYHKEMISILEKYPPKEALQILCEKEPWSLFSCLAKNVFAKILLKTKNKTSDGYFSDWLNDVPEEDSSLNALLLDWMIKSLREERRRSRLPLQPKLAHLIEPLKRELESKGDDVALENLKLILERNSNKTNP